MLESEERDCIEETVSAVVLRKGLRVLPQIEGNTVTLWAELDECITSQPSSSNPQGAHLQHQLLCGVSASCRLSKPFPSSSELLCFSPHTHYWEFSWRTSLISFFDIFHPPTQPSSRKWTMMTATQSSKMNTFCRSHLQAKLWEPRATLASRNMDRQQLLVVNNAGSRPAERLN